MLNNNDFKRELFKLLQKHNAYIQFNVGSSSDTHGLYGETMTVCQRIPDTFKDVVLIEIDGWGINANDLKDETC
jgi:hypothetical protein